MGRISGGLSNQLPLDFWRENRKNCIPFGNKTFTVSWEEFLGRLQLESDY
jgi:hypothetical protein